MHVFLLKCVLMFLLIRVYSMCHKYIFVKHNITCFLGIQCYMCFLLMLKIVFAFNWDVLQYESEDFDSTEGCRFFSLVQ